MPSWNKNVDAHVATWMVEMAITDLGLSFDDSRTLTMRELTQKVPGAGATMDGAAIDAHLIAFFRSIKLYKPTWQNVTYKEGQENRSRVMEDPDLTWEELANVVDSVLLFRGELEGDYA